MLRQIFVPKILSHKQIAMAHNASYHALTNICTWRRCHVCVLPPLTI